MSPPGGPGGDPGGAGVPGGPGLVAGPLPRSYLYVPGDVPAMLARALERGADGLILDLEDAVAPSTKAAARRAVAAWLEGAPAASLDGTGSSPERTELWVRVNPGPLRGEDLRAVVGPALTGVCLAKVESASELDRVSEVLGEAEAASGLPEGRVAVAPLLESAGAMLAARDIAAGPRVVQVQVGEVDLASELGIEPGPDERELLWVRSRLVLVSRAAGLRPPTGPIWADYRDLDGLRRTSVALRRLGYCGRACIHPAQVEVVHQVFTPGPAEVEAARTLLRRFEEAVAAGSGVITDAGGAMVDEAMVRAARRTLALAREP